MRNLLALLLFISLPVGAEVQSRAVEYDYDGEKLTGYLFWDDVTTEKRPGVLVVHEWWGLNDYAKERARMLAELGYVAFAADMYGGGRVTDQPDQAREWMQEVTADVEGWRERAELGLAQLKASDLVDAERVAAIGYCFGGGTVLQMAYGGTSARGVVSFHGSLPAAPEESAGKIGARVLAYHGYADGFVKPEVVANFKEKLQAAGAQWRFDTFGGDVRHGFTNPKAGEYGIEALKYDAQADFESWQGMQAFFSDLFAR